ncbi:hypothetical protein, partial [Anaerovibrio sp.]|uniref:hypothetical protein n=1 Tax=Anaerovibrio sp. TaxID=1872532 RepID=UPI00388F9134
MAMAASEIYTENNEIAVWEYPTEYTGAEAVAKYPGGVTIDMVSYDSTTKKFSFTGGTWNAWKITGGRTDSGNISGYSVELKDVVSGEAYGQWLDVNGAYTGNGNANGNRVKLVNSIVKNVYGSHCNNGEAQNNIVTLENSTVYSYLYGGLGAILNVTGNTLNLYGANSAYEVANFETINIKEAKWGTPALRLTGPDGIKNTNGTRPTINTVDINFSNLNELPVKGTYTILIQNKMANYPTNNIAYGRYTVGTTLEGTGTASVADGDNDGTADDLIYTADTGSEASGGAGGSSGGPTAREQT